MTEHDPHALAFARANALLNGCSNVKIMTLDWNKPELNGLFDPIIGSEVIYHERDFEPIEKLFREYLKPGGRSFLLLRRENKHGLFQLMQEHYKVQARKKTLRSEGKSVPVILCKMRSKGEAPQ